MYSVPNTETMCSRVQCMYMYLKDKCWLPIVHSDVDVSYNQLILQCVILEVCPKRHITLTLHSAVHILYSQQLQQTTV